MLSTADAIDRQRATLVEQSYTTANWISSALFLTGTYGMGIVLAVLLLVLCYWLVTLLRRAVTIVEDSIAAHDRYSRVGERCV